MTGFLVALGNVRVLDQQPTFVFPEHVACDFLDAVLRGQESQINVLHQILALDVGGAGGCCGEVDFEELE